MSTTQRIVLLVAAIAVAVLAFVIAQPGGDDEDGERSATTTPAETGTEAESETGTEQAEPQPPPEPEPEVFRIRLQGGVPAGGRQDLQVERGDTVRIVVTANSADDIHLHGYDIERQAAPGRPARFNFEADAEGAFEIESHVAEDTGREPLIARLVVNPS